MKNCRECSNDIDIKLEVCPHCGAKQPPMHVVRTRSIPFILFSSIFCAGLPILAIYLLPIYFSLAQSELEETINPPQEEIIDERLDSLDYVLEIDYDDFLGFINGYHYEDRYIMIGNYDDPESKEFLKKVNRTLIDYDYKVYYLEITYLTQDQIEYVKTLDPVYTTFGEVPCLYFISDNSEKIMKDKNTTFDEYKEFIENNEVKRKVKR